MGLPLFLALLLATACVLLLAESRRLSGVWARGLIVGTSVLLLAVIVLGVVAVVQAVDDGQGAAVRVAVKPDWLTYLTAFATILAALLALASIVYSAMQARRAEQALLLERRLDFELTLLAEMSRQFSITGTRHLAGYARALLPASAPDDDLPVLRAFTGIRSTAACTARLRAVSEAAKAGKGPVEAKFDAQGAVQNAIRNEIVEAIDRRLPR